MSPETVAAGRRPDRDLERCLRGWREWAAGATSGEARSHDDEPSSDARWAVAAVGLVATHLADARRAPAPMRAAIGSATRTAGALAADTTSVGHGDGDVDGGAPADAAALAVRTVATASAAGVEPPWLFGMIYEACLTRSQRRRGGVFYTPAVVASRLVQLALDGHPPGAGPPRVLDPACGSGVFLLAAAEWLRRSGVEPHGCLAALQGVDVDAGAVDVARLALVWWTWQAAGGDEGAVDPAVAQARRAIRRGDGLALEPGPLVGELDAVIGNPPFLNQLQRHSARSSPDRQRLHERFGPAARGYVDSAALFLLAAVDLIGAGGRVVLVQPESALVASHAAELRHAVAERAVLEGLWLGGAGVFPAGVRVCAPVLRRPPRERCSTVAAAAPTGPVGAAVEPAAAAGLEPAAADRLEPAGHVALWTGPTVAPAGRFDVDSTDRRRALAAGRWAPVLAAGRGVPTITIGDHGTLAELATATAGFRDQFYGLIPFVRDHEARAHEPGDDGTGWQGAAEGRWRPLITSGAVGLTGTRWGWRATRFAGTRWTRPVVDLAALAAGDERLHRWVCQRLRPKLMVATQTPVLCAAVDPGGVCIPSVPVIAVEVPEQAGDEALWRIAALLWSPLLSAVAAERFAGAGLSAGALRLSARQVLSLPLPSGTVAWQEAARRLRSHCAAQPGPSPNGDHLGQRLRDEVDHLVGAAYGIDPEAAHQAKRWWDRATIRHDPVTFL